MGALSGRGFGVSPEVRATRYALYEEAFTIYKKANMDAEAMDVLLTNMCSLERAVPICKTSVRFVADLSHIFGKLLNFQNFDKMFHGKKTMMFTI